MAYRPQILEAVNGGTGASNVATSGKILIGNGTAFVASTPTYPNSSASAGKILISDGTNFIASTPTYPNASATSGKILISDGTNFISSTPTFPNAAGTSGNVLTSDGTNWSSSAASGGGLLSATVILTNAQVKALHGTPIAIVAAQGAGKVTQIVAAIGKMTYGGTNVFTAGSGQTIGLAYGVGNIVVASCLNNSTIVNSATSYCIPILSADTNQTVALVENIAVNAYNPIVTEITGNAANDNTITISVLYRVLTI